MRHLNSLATLENPAVLCVNMHAPETALMRETLREQAVGVSAKLIEHQDTYTARQWLTEWNANKLTNITLPDLALVVVNYNKKEFWSLTSLLSTLFEWEREASFEVLLITEGPRWALPVRLTDFPLLTVVPPWGAIDFGHRPWQF